MVIFNICRFKIYYLVQLFIVLHAQKRASCRRPGDKLYTEVVRPISECIRTACS